MLAGPPVDLSAFQGLPLTTKVLQAATEAIMKDITSLLARLRGETPPAEPYHPAVARRKARQEVRDLQDQNATDGPPGSGTALGSGTAPRLRHRPRLRRHSLTSSAATDSGAGHRLRRRPGLQRRR